jgi:competence protein ComEA
MRHGTRFVRALVPALLAALIGAVSPALAGDASPRLTGVVNVNTATLEELQLLPGIGEARAKEVIALRKRQGGFKSLDDLVAVRGIGESSLERLRPYVRFEGKTTAQLVPPSR